MSKNRVTPAGKLLGQRAAILADLGHGLLQQIGLADVKAPRLRAEMCSTCACRRGSVPNGCQQTQMDFLKAVVEGLPFLCHAPHDGKICAGWVRARAEVVANPPPKEFVDLITGYDYSPPDDAAHGIGGEK